MSDDRSILRRMEEHGHHAPRVRLAGTERNDAATTRYEVAGEIARGGVGVVHKGRDNDLGRDVALKVLHERHLQSAELVQRFVEEAQIGGQLQHPGIVPVYELGLQADQRPFFAMKLVKGETLAKRLAAGNDSRRALLAVFRDVCRTMAYAHSRGVVHRDLKPSNVMIGSFGEVQVVDWGFAKVLRKGGVADERLRKKAKRDITMISTVRDSESVAGSVMGTPAYMPPEQAMGRVDELDEKSDLFSLGAILCEILTGEPPYESDLAAAAEAKLAPAHARLDACGADPRLIALCKRCLDPLPKNRPADATELADTIAGYIASAEGRAHRAHVRALKAGASADEQRRARRQTKIVGTSLVALLALAVGGYLWNDAARTRRAHERQAAIETALQDAERARKATDWEAALAAAQRAIDLGHDRALVAAIRAEAKENAARAMREKEDDALLAQLDEIRGRRGLVEHDDNKATDAAYAAAFEGVSDERLAASRHAAEFAANLGYWSWIRKTRLKAAGWEEIDARARRIDPTTADLRGALLADDADALLAALTDDLPLALAEQIGVVLTAQRPAAAVAFLKQQHLRAPGDFWIHVRLVAAALKNDEPLLAAFHATAAIAVRPDHTVAWRALGNALKRNDDRDGALAAYEKALALAPESAANHNNRATLLPTIEERIAAYRRAIEIDPGLAAPHANLAIELTSAGDVDGAVTAARRAIDLGSHTGYSALGSALGRKGDVDGAIAAFRRRLELDPDDAPTRCNLSGAFFRKGELEAAIEAARRAIEIDPELAPAHNNLGIALKAMGDLAGALAAHRRAVQLDPETANAHYNLGGALKKAGDLEGAVRALRRAIELEPEDVMALVSLGQALTALGELDDAIETLNRALTLEPKSMSALSKLGIALFRGNRFTEAVVVYRRAAELQPENGAAYSNLGAALAATGDYAGSRVALRRAVELDPDDAMAHYNIGLAFREMGDDAGAITGLRRAEQCDPVHVLILRELAAAYSRTGDAQNAIEYARRALALAPSDARMRSYLRHHLTDGYGAELRRVLGGAAPPADATARADMAELCGILQRYPDAVALYRLAFAADPKLVADHGYEAGCAAAMTGAEEALPWLRAYVDGLRDRHPKIRAAARERLTNDERLKSLGREQVDALVERAKK